MCRNLTVIIIWGVCLIANTCLLMRQATKCRAPWQSPPQFSPIAQNLDRATGNMYRVQQVLLSPTFCNKVCREAFVEEILVLKGVVQLCIGHGPALKPAVEHLVHAPEGLAPAGAGDGQAINEMAMEVRRLQPTHPAEVACDLNNVAELARLHLTAEDDPGHSNEKDRC